VGIGFLPRLNSIIVGFENSSERRKAPEKRSKEWRSWPFKLAEGGRGEEPLYKLLNRIGSYNKKKRRLRTGGGGGFQ